MKGRDLLCESFLLLFVHIFYSEYAAKVSQCTAVVEEKGGERCESA